MANDNYNSFVEKKEAENRNQRSERSECGDGEANRNGKVMFDHEKLAFCHPSIEYVAWVTKLLTRAMSYLREEQTTYGKEKIDYDYEHEKTGFNKANDQIARSCASHRLFS